MMTKEKPIIFSTSMVRAIMDGRKTQTRRVCKALENYDFSWGLDRKPYIGDYKTFAKVAPRKWDNVTLENVWLYDLQTAVDESKTYVLKPSYKPGDILWVRETWAHAFADTTVCGSTYALQDQYVYKADNPDLIAKWRPPRYMPREAARLWLEVKNVRVERLQDISHEDAVAEGTLQWICEKYKSGSYFDNAMRGAACAKPERAFALLWDSINAKRGYPWENNDWVWVYEFMRIE